MKSVSSCICIVALSGMLYACAVSQAADGVGTSNTIVDASRTVEQQTVSIDWERANADVTGNANTVNSAQQRNATPTSLAVPLLLPPSSITLSDATPPVQTLSTAKVLTDARGYSAVVDAETFTILIDASNQTFVTEQRTNTLSQDFFDGEYQLITNGGQISIGRYGALYAVQLLCAREDQMQCITERMVREVIESLSVKRLTP